MIKNHIKYLTLICLLFFGRHSFAQSPVIKVSLDQFVEDTRSKKMQSIIPVYKYPKTVFEDPINNGVDTKKEFGTFNAILPDLAGYNDTCYAYFYFGALNERKELPGYVMAIIVNNKREYKKPAKIWLDRNYNLDFRDDGDPIAFDENAGYMDLTFVNPKIKNAVYTVNISRYPFTFNSKYLGMLDDYYALNSGSKTFAGSLYSFREQRVNTIAGDYKYEDDSFRIAIKDVNCNGIYTDAEQDYIIVGDYKTTLMPDNVIPIHAKEGKTYFERDGKRYNILNIDRVGTFIEIQRDDDAKISNSLVVGKKIKKFKFYTPEKERKTVSIKKYRKKPTYIYVWRFDQDGFTKDTAALRIIARDYADKINLVTLNYGETPKELRAFRAKNKINWHIGMSTQKINNKLFIEKYPYGVLTGKRLKIKQLKISPQELLILLQNNLI